MPGLRRLHLLRPGRTESSPDSPVAGTVVAASRELRNGSPGPASLAGSHLTASGILTLIFQERLMAETEEQKAHRILLLLEQGGGCREPGTKASTGLRKRLSPLRYPGGKSKLIDFIYARCPRNRSGSARENSRRALFFQNTYQPAHWPLYPSAFSAEDHRRLADTLNALYVGMPGPDIVVT